MTRNEERMLAEIEAWEKICAEALEVAVTKGYQDIIELINRSHITIEELMKEHAEERKQKRDKKKILSIRDETELNNAMKYIEDRLDEVRSMIGELGAEYRSLEHVLQICHDKIKKIQEGKNEN